MLIHVITDSFPDTKNQQKFIFVYEQCKALVSAGHKVVVLCAEVISWREHSKSNTETTKQRMKDSSEGISIYRLYYKATSSIRIAYVSNYIYTLKTNKLYDAAVLDFGKPDVLWAHFTYMGGYASYLLSKKYKIPYIVTEHSSALLKSDYPYQNRKMLKTVVESANTFICVSESLKSAVIKWTGTKKDLPVIPDPIDHRFSYHERIENPFFVFFSAGNLVDSKRFDLLIHAFCDAFEINDSVILRIAGDGVNFNELQDLIEKNHRQEQIRLCGRLSRDEMFDEYVNCDVFVLPSRYETFGIVYREAMAVGRPVISTKNGGIEDGWQPCFGELVDVDNEKALAQALKLLRNNLELYDGKMISQLCLKYCSSKSFNDMIMPILKTIGDRK